ncbi:MAG: hypothetical protein Q9M20_04460 [Mariprofundaceae bacterium]|nr:hypothetical protein [Mariprofundaceae bacterium]
MIFAVWRRVPQKVVVTFFCGICFFGLLGIGAAQAPEDPRFYISMDFDNGIVPPLPEQVVQALPILWDRIITQQARASMPKNIKPMALLRRIQPQQQGSVIEFNAARVWARLEKDHIPHIRSITAFNLKLEMSNAFGSRMTSSERDLLAFIQQKSSGLGIQTQLSAPLLAIRVQWLGDTQVQVSVRGQSRLEEFSERRVLQAGNPFLQIETWLIQILMRARDAYQWKPEAVLSPSQQAALAGSPSLQLLIKQQATLSEQITLETALQADTRVQSVTPTYLNHYSQAYRIQLKQIDDRWLLDWFAKRGMHAARHEQGWLIQ